MKAIIVGLGGRGRGWLKDCRANSDVEVVACVEPFAPNKERAIKELGVPKEQLYDTLNDACKAVKADFVVDVTPPAQHESVAMTAFENKLHVLGEKPLSDNYEAAKRVVTAGKKAGLKHMITQNYRYAGLPRTTARLIKEGVIGPVAQIDASLYVPWADAPGSHYVTEPFMFLTDMGIHHFDMMRYMIEGEPVSAQAITWNLPWGWHKGDACQLILFRFSNGVVGTHRGVGCTMGHVPAGHNGEWRIEGPQGSLTWEGFDLFLSRHHRQEKKVREKITLDQNDYTGGPPALLKEFVKALKENRQPECNAEDNLRSMGMVFAAVKSAKEKREVSVSEL